MISPISALCSFSDFAGFDSLKDELVLFHDDDGGGDWDSADESVDSQVNLLSILHQIFAIICEMCCFGNGSLLEDSRTSLAFCCKI